jgi:hypothetical protein
MIIVTDKQIEEKNKKIEKLNSDIEKKKQELDDFLNGKIYEEAFEWRFEFPEVLDKDGNFLGFDAVIGNPPYIDSETMVNMGQGSIREHINSKFKYTKGNWDIYVAFFELAFILTNKNKIVSFITPDKWLSKPFGEELRKAKLSNLLSLVRAGRGVFLESGIDAIITIFGKNSNTFSYYEFIDNKINYDNIIEKKLLDYPYQLDVVFSQNIQLLFKISSNFNKLSSLSCACENACATSDAYILKDIIKDYNSKLKINNYFKMVNTGTINKYISNWGVKEMTYLGNKYLSPVVKKSDFAKTFKNTYSKKAEKMKIIIKGLTLLYGMLDIKGEYIPGKTTIIITSEDKRLLFYLLAIINSKFAQFYINERYSASSYNGGISFTKDMIMSLPVPDIDTSNLDKNLEYNKIILLIDNIITAKEKNPSSDTLKLEKAIDDIIYSLYKLTPEEIEIVEKAR